MKRFSLNPFKQRPARRRWRDDRQALLELNRSLSLIADPNALMASIAARLKEMFGTDRAILLRTTDVGTFTVAFSTGYNADELKNVRLSQRDRLAKWLLTNETSLVIEEETHLFNYLSLEEQDMLARLQVRLCVPLVSMNRLTGMMLLSSSKSWRRLEQDDLSLLQVIMSQASISFENAYLYQQQRDRFRLLTGAERLAAAGLLAASLAHEIRNPLTSIRSAVQYLQGEFDENNPKRDLIGGVISEVDRIDRILDGLLSLTRGTEFKPERIALGQLIRQTLLLVRAQSDNQAIEIGFVQAPSELFILGDVAQLKQLFLNLMLNAIQAMQNGGKLQIDLSVKPQSIGSSSERAWANLVLKDTGCGIPAESLDKVFDPFFTTKQAGTGLGLFTSYAIAQQHGGEIEIESVENEGTTIAIRFPLIK